MFVPTVYKAVFAVVDVCGDKCFLPTVYKAVFAVVDVCVDSYGRHIDCVDF